MTRRGGKVEKQPLLFFALCLFMLAVKSLFFWQRGYTGVRQIQRVFIDLSKEQQYDIITCLIKFPVVSFILNSRLCMVKCATRNVIGS